MLLGILNVVRQLEVQIVLRCFDYKRNSWPLRQPQIDELIRVSEKFVGYLVLLILDQVYLDIKQCDEPKLRVQSIFSLFDIKKLGELVEEKVLQDGLVCIRICRLALGVRRRTSPCGVRNDQGLLHQYALSNRRFFRADLL